MSKVVLFLLATASVAWCLESGVGYSGYSGYSFAPPGVSYVGTQTAPNGQASSDSSLLQDDDWREEGDVYPLPRTTAVLVEDKAASSFTLTEAFNASYDIVHEFTYWYAKRLKKFNWNGTGFESALDYASQACQSTLSTNGGGGKDWSKGWSPYPDLTTTIEEVIVSWKQYQNGNFYYFGGQACADGYDRYSIRYTTADLETIDFAVPTLQTFCDGRAGLANATSYLPTVLKAQPFGGARFMCCKAGTGECAMKKVCTSASNRQCIGL